MFSNSSSSIYFHWNNNPADRHLHLFHLNVHVTHSTYTGSTFDWRENDILHTYWGDIMYFGVCFLWRFPCHFTMLSLNSTVYFLINIRTLCGRARSTLCCVFSGSRSSPLHSFGNKTEKLAVREPAQLHPRSSYASPNMRGHSTPKWTRKF